MKYLNNLQIAIVTTSYLLLFSFNSSAQNIGINSTGATPDSSALLDLNSTDKGFLITRVDTANIATPAFGLMTLSPIDSCLYMYSGTSWMSIGGVGSNCNGNGGTGTVPSCTDNVTQVVNITSITGEIWMDRNLGATQVATSSTDAASYGDLYQWGRCADGHEKRTSGTTSTQSTTDTPGHSDFINTGSADWRSPKNDNLWQGVAGINNPCPTGYRLPTQSELDAEILSWTTNGAPGAFASPLKLPVAGSRDSYGVLQDVGSIGFYWSSTVSSIPNLALKMLFIGGNSGVNEDARSIGFSVRCIQD